MKRRSSSLYVVFISAIVFISILTTGIFAGFLINAVNTLSASDPAAIEAMTGGTASDVSPFITDDEDASLFDETDANESASGGILLFPGILDIQHLTIILLIMAIVLVPTACAAAVYIFRAVCNEINVVSKDNKKLTEQNSQMTKTNTERDQRVQLLGKLTSGLAFEFCGLLAPIVGYASQLQSVVREEDPIRADIDEIHSASTRALGVVQQFAMIYSGGRHYTQAPVSLETVVSNVLESVNKVKPDYMAINVNCDFEGAQIQGSQSQLTNMFMNIFTNAFEAISNIKPDVSAKNARHIWLKGEIADRGGSPYARIRIEDDGIGIDKQNLPKIFEPFYSTKSNTTGAGLGLTVVKSIASQHNAIIEVRSVAGQGTEFTIDFPLASGGKTAPNKINAANKDKNARNGLEGRDESVSNTIDGTVNSASGNTLNRSTSNPANNSTSNPVSNSMSNAANNAANNAASNAANNSSNGSANNVVGMKKYMKKQNDKPIGYQYNNAPYYPGNPRDSQADSRRENRLASKPGADGGAISEIRRIFESGFNSGKQGGQNRQNGQNGQNGQHGQNGQNGQHGQNRYGGHSGAGSQNRQGGLNMYNGQDGQGRNGRYNGNGAQYRQENSFNNYNSSFRAAQSAYRLKVLKGGASQAGGASEDKTGGVSDNQAGANQTDSGANTAGVDATARTNATQSTKDQSENGNTRTYESAREAGIAIGLHTLPGGLGKKLQSVRREEAEFEKLMNSKMDGRNREASARSGPLLSNRLQRSINVMSVAIVDGNSTAHRNIQNVLTANGYEVRTFNTPLDTLEALRKDPCNILIAPSKMDQMNGQVLAELAKLANGAAHVLLTLDCNEGGALGMMRKEQIDGYLMKPISANELMDKLSVIVDAEGPAQN